MDPLADKLLITAALFSLVAMELVPAWIAVLIVGREFAVTVLRSLAQTRGVIIAASPLGKIKMVAEVVAILALILASDQGRNPLFVLGTLALWLAMITALVSGFDYYRKFNHVVKM